MRTLAALAALIVAPVVLLLLLRLALSDSLDEVNVPPAPVVVQPEMTQITDERVAIGRLVWSEPDALLAPAWNGVVTAVHVTPGAIVQNGDPVLAINGVTRVAVHAAQPFWRGIEQGDQGEDVEEAQRFLASQGLYSGPIDGQFGRATATATTAWKASLGIREADGTFDPSLIVWLSSDRLQVATTFVRVGSPAPAQGSELAAGPPVLEMVELLTSRDQPIDLDRPGDWEFIYAGRLFAIDDVEPAQLANRGLKELSALLAAEQPAVEGVVRRVETEAALMIPSTAVMTNVDGETCVWVGDGDRFEARSVAIADGTTSRTRILDGLLTSDHVLVNPGIVLAASSCP